MSTILEDLIQISFKVSLRGDWVQAGGGNTSVKHGDSLFIKASGKHLSELSVVQGIAELNTPEVVTFLNESQQKSFASKKEKESWVTQSLNALSKNNQKPSIETFMHAVLGPAVIHVHPYGIIAKASIFQGARQFENPKNSCFYIDYVTPGLDLGLVIQEVLQRHQCQVQTQCITVVMQNHGILVSAPTLELAYSHLGKYLNESSPMPLKTFSKPYEGAQAIFDLLLKRTSAYWFVQPVFDLEIESLMKENSTWIKTFPFTPDKMVYCGYTALNTTSETTYSDFDVYTQNYPDLPKTWILDGQVYTVGKTQKQAQDAQAVLKAHLIEQCLMTQAPVLLSQEECEFLVNWDAEKFRQGL